VDSGPVLSEAKARAPHVSLTRADLESDAAEMELNGTPEQYAEVMALIDSFGPRRVAPTTIQRERESIAAVHIRYGIDSAVSRAFAPSEVRKARMDRERAWLDRVTAEMIRDRELRKRDPKAFIRSLRK